MGAPALPGDWSRAGPPAAEEKSGEQIYRDAVRLVPRRRPARGRRNIPAPLAGDRSPAQLARLIAKTMPEDDPGTCVGEDAEKVAAYIHDAFYSKAAQARNKPARVELSRLTVRQYRNAVADLVGSFRGAGDLGRRARARGRVFQVAAVPRRTTGSIDRRRPRGPVRLRRRRPRRPTSSTPTSSRSAGKGRSSPPRPASTSSSSGPSTPTRLWVNDPKRPLIDAWVKSGNDTEYRGVDLPARRPGLPAPAGVLQGQAGGGRLEEEEGQAAAGQGVDRPGVEAAAPGRRGRSPRGTSRPDRSPEAFVVDDAVPARRPERRLRARDVGLEGLGPGHDRRGDRGRRLRRRPPPRAGRASTDDAADREAKLREFCRKFAERAFRRPLTDEQKAALRRPPVRRGRRPRDGRQAGRSCWSSSRPGSSTARSAAGPTPTTWPRGSRSASGTRSPTGRCSRPPPPGRLADPRAGRRQAERMVDDLRARAKVREFFLQWLRVDQRPRPRQGPRAVPRVRRGRSPPTCGPRSTCSSTTWSGASRPTSASCCWPTTLYLNGRLAKFYGADLPADAPFQKVALDPGERAGVLTHPYLMATLRLHRRRARRSTAACSSPGASWAGRSGRRPRPSPRWPPTCTPGLTTRERVDLQTSPTVVHDLPRR